MQEYYYMGRVVNMKSQEQCAQSVCLQCFSNHLKSPLQYVPELYVSTLLHAFTAACRTSSFTKQFADNTLPFVVVIISYFSRATNYSQLYFFQITMTMCCIQKGFATTAHKCFRTSRREGEGGKGEGSWRRELEEKNETSKVIELIIIL